MKDKVFLRVGKTKSGFVYKVSKMQNNCAIEKTSDYSKRHWYPTILIRLNLEIPDEIFKKARAELDLKINEAEINSKIKITEADPLDEIFVEEISQEGEGKEK